MPAAQTTPPRSSIAESRIEEALIALVRRSNDPRSNAVLTRRAGVDLERSGWVLLTRIAELEPVRLVDIAEAAGIEASTASRQVARLVEKGYVTREADAEDQRALAHRLSPAGREAFDRLRHTRREWMTDVLEVFTEAERDQLADLLGRLVERLPRV